MPKINKKTVKEHNLFIRFFKKLLDPTQYTSIKSLAMLSAIVISFGLTTCLGYTMIVDAQLDGVLDMDLIEAGIFVTCIGSFMSLASIPKVIIDRMRAKSGFPQIPEEEVYNEEKEDCEE